MEPPKSATQAFNPIEEAFNLISKGLEDKTADTYQSIINKSLRLLLEATQAPCSFSISTLTKVEEGLYTLISEAEKMDESQKSKYRTAAENCLTSLAKKELQQEQTEWYSEAFQGLSLNDPREIGHAFTTKAQQLILKGKQEGVLAPNELNFLYTVQTKISNEWNKAQYLYAFVYTLLIQSYAWQQLLPNAEFIKLEQDGLIDLDQNKMQKLSPEQFAFFVQWRHSMTGNCETIVAFLREAEKNEAFLQRDVKHLLRSLETCCDLEFYDSFVTGHYKLLQKLPETTFDFLPHRLQDILSEVLKHVPIIHNRASKGFTSLTERTAFFERYTEELHLLAQTINGIQVEKCWILHHLINEILSPIEQIKEKLSKNDHPRFVPQLLPKELFTRCQDIFACGVSKTTALSLSGFEDIITALFYRKSSVQEPVKEVVKKDETLVSKDTGREAVRRHKRDERAYRKQHQAPAPQQTSPPTPKTEPSLHKHKEPKKLQIDDQGILLAKRVRDWMQDSPEALKGEPYIHLSQQENELSKLLHTYPVVITRIMRKYCIVSQRSGDTHYSCPGAIIRPGQPTIEGYFADCFSKQSLELYHHFFHEKPLHTLIDEAAKGRAPLDADLDVLQGSDLEPLPQENRVVDTMDLSDRYLIIKKLYSIEVEDTKNGIRYVLMFPHGLR